MTQESSSLLVHLQGRLDAHAAPELTRHLASFRSRHLVLDLTEVSYLSSAALRLFILLHKKCAAQNGVFCLAGVQPYCREVLRVGGMETLFPLYETPEAAIASLKHHSSHLTTECGTFEEIAGSDEPGGVEVLGDIKDVLASRITAQQLYSKRFSSKEYSLGLGALAATTEEALDLMGEMITIGGTMVWLPTDGNDTPDYLVPKVDSHLVTIRTGFNASIKGPFNEFFHFRSSQMGGTPLSEIYRALFDLAKLRRNDFKGAIGLAMRADVGEVYGAGALKSPRLEHAPENGLEITDPANFEHWFAFDTAPRHRNVTGLITGIGLDLTADLSAFSQELLGATFYINPANHPTGKEQLHNHGVFFSKAPFADPPLSLEEEIASVVENGDFIDMRHLLDATRITRALIGVVYIQDFWPDLSGCD